MIKTQAALSESIRFRLDNAYRNAESLFSGVISSCQGWKSTVDESERKRLERIQEEAYQAINAIQAVQHVFKERV